MSCEITITIGTERVEPHPALIAQRTFMIKQTFGNTGVLMSAFLLGLTDMDALTFSMARLGDVPTATGLAAKAIAVGMIANTCLKGTMVLLLATNEPRRVAGGGLAALGTACGFGVWLAR